MNKNLLNKISRTLLLIAIGTCWSCSNNDDVEKFNRELVSIPIIITEMIEDGETVSRSAEKQAEVAIPINNDFYAVVNLEPEPKLKPATRTDTGTNLGDGITYRVIAYKGSTVTPANYFSHQDFIVGETATMSLEKNTSYTLVCYSEGKKNPITAFNYASNAPIHEINADGMDPMYYKTTLNTSSTPSLNITFKHMTSKIEAVTIDTNFEYIESYKNVRLEPHYQSADLDLASGNPTMKGSAESKVLIADSTGLREITLSVPTSRKVITNNQQLTLRMDELKLKSDEGVVLSIPNYTVNFSAIAYSKKYKLKFKLKKRSIAPGELTVGNVVWSKGYGRNDNGGICDLVYYCPEGDNWHASHKTDHVTYAKQSLPTPPSGWRIPSVAEATELGKVVYGPGRVRDNDYGGWWYGTKELPRTAVDQKKYIFFQTAFNENPNVIGARYRIGFHTNFWGSSPHGICGVYVLIGHDGFSSSGPASEQIVATGFMTYYYGWGIGGMRGPTRYVRTAP